ncbi:polysaccharide deacetylase [Paenibacillus physcomitrellae]|uniref:NodB homology domain-containing protein n=1 Tax=Paenibacillus physcomitrellae TaxID=1619311 RepID=A0ABQ1FRZ5_9BACL|nr:polysaccharide deacetylase [Paenibacillus physcomitrellae]GGA27134.1 hypothetical protein GCM10010917_09950 [Paenibacillus physcomitrellae]
MPGKRTFWMVLVSCLLLAALPGPQANAASGSLKASSKAAPAASTALLGLNDELTDLLPVFKDGSYYVPVREAAQLLGLKLTGTPQEIVLTSAGGAVLLLEPDGGKAVKPDGMEAETSMFVEKGSTRVQLGLLARSFGYPITYEADKRLLRVVTAKGALDNEKFDAAHKSEIDSHLKAVKEAEQQAKPAPPKSGHGDSGKTLYLTFDDGPSAHTGQLLDILDRYEVKATFFMLGNHISSYSDSVKRMVKEGDAVGLHGMTHQKELFYKTPEAALQEMDDDNERLYKAAGVKSALVRPPYGSKPYFTEDFRDKVLGAGYHLWDWNVDSQDWKFKEDIASTYANVMKQVKTISAHKTSPVVLMHDLPTTIQVLPKILAELKKEGYAFAVITAEQKPVNFWNDER